MRLCSIRGRAREDFMHHTAGTRARPLWKEAAAVLGAAAAMAAAANVEVPFYPVPMTLQTLAVTGAGLLLGLRRGAGRSSVRAPASTAGVRIAVL